MVHLLRHEIEVKGLRAGCICMPSVMARPYPLITHGLAEVL